MRAEDTFGVSINTTSARRHLVALDLFPSTLITGRADLNLGCKFRAWRSWFGFNIEDTGFTSSLATIARLTIVALMLRLSALLTGLVNPGPGLCLCVEFLLI